MINKNKSELQIHFHGSSEHLQHAEACVMSLSTLQI